MSLDHLPDAGKKRVCVACKAFKAECQAPVGEDSAAMCWLCAHQVVDHGAPIHEAAEARCECTPDKVYPRTVLRERERQLEVAKLRGFQPMSVLLDDYMARVKDTGPSSDRPDRLKKH